MFSYVNKKGISIFFGGYPDEKYSYLLLFYNEFAQYDRVFHLKNIYAISYILLWVISILFQHYLLLPIVLKLREYEQKQEQKQNLQILNNLTESFKQTEENKDGELNSSDAIVIGKQEKIDKK